MLENLLNHVDRSLSFDTLGILIALVALEAILGADNAIALASLVEPISERKRQHQVLNWGLVVAFILRIVLILTATWIIQFWQFELAGAFYLLWLASKYFWERLAQKYLSDRDNNYSKRRFNSLWQIIILIAITDLAFSLDSITTAVALASQAWLIITGAIIGVITLRFLAFFFIILLSQFIYLQDAVYLTIFAVGTRLLFKALLPDRVPPEWIILVIMFIFLAWGFSKRVRQTSCASQVIGNK